MADIEIKYGTSKTFEAEVKKVSDYSDLKNKPTINGVEIEGNKTAEDYGIEVPAKTSELENDSGYCTEQAVDEKIGDINSILDSINGEVV